MRSSRSLRWAVRLVAGAALLGVVLGLALVLALRSPGVRQSILEWVSGRVERQAGIRLEAADFRVGLGRGSLEVQDLRLYATTADSPFLAAERAEAGYSWVALLGDTVELESVLVERARLDLEAPLPAREERSEDESESPEPSAPARAPIEVRTIQIRDASVRSAPAPAAADVWLDRWRADALEIAGSYLDGALSIELAAGRIAVESHRRPGIEVAVEAAGGRTADGELDLTSLTAVGDGLRLELGASGRLDDQIQVEGQLDAQLGRLVPDLTPGGEVRGRFEAVRVASSIDGRVDAAVEGLPAVLLDPFLPEAGTQRLQLEGSHLDAEARIELRGLRTSSGLPDLEGDVDLLWRRDSRALMEASVRAVAGSAERESAVTLEAALLPAGSGRRDLRAELGIPDWREPSGFVLREARLDLEEPDLERAARLLGVADEWIDRWGLRGALEVAVRGQGPLLRPEVDGRATWLDGDETVLRLALASPGGFGLTGEGGALVDLEAELLPEAPGRRYLEARASIRSLKDLARLELKESRLLVDSDNSADLLRRLRERWPVVEQWLDPVEPFAEGELSLDLAASGVALRPFVELEAVWRPRSGESVEIRGAGRLLAESPYLDGPATLSLDARGFRLERLGLAADEGEILTGEMNARAELQGTLEDLSGHLLLSGEGLGSPESPWLEALTIEAEARDGWLQITSASARLSEELGGGRFEAQAGAELGLPIRRAKARLELREAAEWLDRVTLDLSLADGVLGIDTLRVALDDADPEVPDLVLRGEIPLAALTSVPAAGAALAMLSVDESEGPVELELEALDLGPIWRHYQPVEDLSLEGVLDASVRFDPNDVSSASGWLSMDGLALAGPKSGLRASDRARVALEGPRLVLEPIQWRGRDAPEGASSPGSMSMSGELRLSSEWTPDEELSQLVERVDLELDGAVDASVLNLFLHGGVGSGPLQLAVRLSGAPETLTGNIRVGGPEATIFYSYPYAARFDSPDVEVEVERGRATIKRATATLNRGRVELTGEAVRGEGLDLRLALDGVRLRLGHGLTLLLGGDLALGKRPEAMPRLEGDVVVERGSLRRDLQLDRELLGALFGGADLDSVEPSPIDDIVLDLSVSTLEGISIKNNLANIQLDWQPLRIRGTVGEPLVRGRFEVDPGGRVTAYGQTVRIDEGALILSGDPDVEPRLVLETTSSLEDPSLHDEERWYADTAWGDRGGWDTGSFRRRESAGTEAITAGVATHYTERLASALGGALLGTEISYRSLQLFGERDTQARWTLSQRLSPRVTFVSSQDPREAEGTTNYLELHGFARAPGVVAQLFKNDRGDRGATLQQTRQLGRERVREGEILLRRVKVDAPKAIPARSIRAASGFRRGDPFPEGSDFEVEIDVHDYLRRNGFPGSTVRAKVQESRRGLVDVVVRIEPGPRVAVSFAGDVPARNPRRAIAALYQPDRFAERASLEEMRRDTVQALRSQGFIHPEVEIRVEPVDVSEPEGDRTVTVRSRGGRRIAPSAPVFNGVDSEVAQQLSLLFETPLERVELAAATPGADAFLVRALRRRGYPEAEVVSRHLSDDGLELTVELAAGPRRLVAWVRIEGLPAAEAEQLAERISLRAGEPIRAEDIGRSLTLIERDLQNRGFFDQRVEVDITEVGEEKHVGVTFDVATGAGYRFGETRVAGLDSTQPEWAQSVLGIEPGTVLTQAEIGAGRSRLTQTRVFRRVGATVERPARGKAPDGESPEWVDAAVTYDVLELPRYSTSYGLRWDSESGLGGAVYVSDRNFLGRGRTLGVRAIYIGDNDRSLGLYHAWPRVGGTPYLLELFAEAVREVDTGILVEGLEGWAQITIPLSARRQSRFYTLLRDREFEDLDPTAPELDEDALELFLGWQFVFDSRDRALGVTSPKGLFLGFDASGSSESLGSDFDELRLFGQGSFFYPLSREPLHSRAEGPLSWAQSARIGWLESFGGVIPTVDRLRAGGEFSVRGYRRDSLGPLDENGDSLGGEVFLILNHEVHVPLWNKLRGVAFFDAGNVWESTAALEADLFTSVGIGLRWSSPVGPLRLDLAHALDGRPEIDPEYKVYFGFGSTF